MFEVFRKKKDIKNPLTVDIHSHLIPGIDDGVRSMEESADVIQEFLQLGYKKLITTPHIMGDFYPNNRTTIENGYNKLIAYLSEKEIDCQIEFAAEYHLDEQLISILEHEKSLLTFGNGYFLFETPFINEPVYLKELIFKITSMGLKPVLAHPERYAYLLNNRNLVEDLINRGVLMQLNMISFTGFYSKPIRKMAEMMVKQGYVHFLGSDCHNLGHMPLIRDAIRNKYFQKAATSQAKNNNL